MRAGGGCEAAPCRLPFPGPTRAAPGGAAALPSPQAGGTHRPRVAEPCAEACWAGGDAGSSAMADRRSAGRPGTRAEEGGATTACPAPGPPPARPPTSAAQPHEVGARPGLLQAVHLRPRSGQPRDPGARGRGRGAGSGRRQPMGARRGAGRREAMPMVRASLCHSGPSGARAGGSGTWRLPLLPGRLWGRPDGSTSRQRAEWMQWFRSNLPARTCGQYRGKGTQNPVGLSGAGGDVRALP